MIASVLSKKHKMLKSAVSELCNKEIASEAADLDRNRSFPWEISGNWPNSDMQE